MKYKVQKYANASRVDGSGTAMDWNPTKYADGGSVGAPSRLTKAAKPAMAKYADGGYASKSKAAKPRTRRRASAGASPAAYAGGGSVGRYASKSKRYNSKRMKGYGE